MSHFFKALLYAYNRFVEDDGLAIASHLAMSFLFALFPFLLVVTSMISIWGEASLANNVLNFVFENWPEQTATQLRQQISVVIFSQNVSVFSFTGLIAIVLASNGIEAARVGLNRAYEATETRSFFWRRLQSILFVILGATLLIVAALCLVAAPPLWTWLVSRMGWLEAFSVTFGLLHYLVPLSILLFGLVFFHKVLPDGKRSVKSLTVGILFTTLGFIVGSKLFAFYLTSIAQYSALYAGLAGIMSALIYLYGVSVLFLFGAELNNAFHKFRLIR